MNAESDKGDEGDESDESVSVENSFFTERGTCVVSRVRIAATFTSRCVGLLNQHSLSKDEGLLLKPGGSIHTLWMRVAIDVLFLDERLRIVRIVQRVRPWRFVLAPPQTRRVLELACGRAAAVGLREGMRLFECRGTNGSQ